MGELLNCGNINYICEKKAFMNLRFIVILIFLASIFTNGFSQRWKLTRYEAVGGIGTTNVFGDIGGTADKSNWFGIKDIRIAETGYSLYLGARYFFTENTAIKYNMIYGHAAGSDANSKNADRQFSYKTSFFEPSVQYEYYFIKEGRRNRMSNIYNRRGMINNYTLLSAYAFGGLGGLIFSPKLTSGGRLPDAATPHFELVDGYSKFSGVLALGAGVKYSIDKEWSIGFEFGRRFTFTDYLDGLSNSKYSHSNDTYYFGVINVIYKLETNRRGIPRIFARY